MESGQATTAGITRDHLERSVGRRFEALAELQPNAVALRSHGDTYTYESLNESANRLAWPVLDRLGEAETAVLVESTGDAWDFVAILALCKAGKPFSVLASGAGDELRESIRRDLQPGLVLSEGQGFLHSGERRNPDLDFGPERAASIVYTSGSTAKPKGVIRTHGNLLHRAWIYRRHSGVGPGDAQALMAPLTHVGAESDLFGAWLNGASVNHHPASLGVAGLENRLAADKITLWHPPVGLLRRFLSLRKAELDLPLLRLIALGGETIYWSDVRAIRSVFGAHMRILHRYSSSEAGNITALEVGEELGLDDEAVPAGFPCEDKHVSVSSRGEVIVRSRFLSRGYWTGRSFDGEYSTGDLGRLDSAGGLHLSGRSDRRVKVRGFLVDLAELEGVLLAQEGVREAAVVAERDRLLAYTVNPPPDLEARVARQLASWMRPDVFIELDEIPLTATGKVDRRSLPPPASRGAKPQPGLEEELTDLWREVLERRDVGADDNFFELGGDSLRASELVTRISRVVGQEVPVAALFRAPSPAEMKLALAEGVMDSSSIVPLADGVGEPWLLSPPPPRGATFYRNLPDLLEGPVFGFDVQWSQAEVCDVAQKIAAEIDAHWPNRRLSLAGFSFGGNLAFEVARRLGDRVTAVVLIDSYAPGFVTGREIDRSLVGNRIAVLRFMFECWYFEALTYARLSGSARKNYLQSVLKQLRGKLQWRFLLRRAFTEAPVRISPGGARHRRPDIYRGRVHVVRFSHPYPGTPSDPYLGWERWAKGRLTTETIQGIHLGLMFQSPWADRLAAVLQRVRSEHE